MLNFANTPFQVLKAWNFVYKNMKKQNPLRCSLAPELKWRYFQFRLQHYSILCLMKNPCYFALDDGAEKPQVMWIAQVYREWIALPASSVWHNPTTNRPARFYFPPPPIAKYLDEIFSDPDNKEVSILSSDIPNTDRTGVRTVLSPHLLLICHYFFYSLVYISVHHFLHTKIWHRTVTNTRIEKKLARFRPDTSPGSQTRLSHQLSKIRPWDPTFWGVAQSSLGILEGLGCLAPLCTS